MSFARFGRLTAVFAALMFSFLGSPTVSVAASDQAMDVAVSMLNGQEITGYLRGLDEQTVRLVSIDGKDVTLDQSELLRLEFATSKQAGIEPVDQPPIELEFTTGDRLPLQAFTLAGDEAILTTPSAIKTKKPTLNVASEIVLAYRQPAGSAFDRQWKNIRQQPTTGDKLVVFRKGGESIDFVEGVVEAVDADGVDLLLDGEPIRVAAAKVYGVVFARDAAEPTQPATPRFIGRSGLSLASSQWQLLPGRQFEIQSPLGFTLKLEPDAIFTIDYSPGRVSYLSDLEPLSADWQPFFGIPEGLSKTDQELGWRYDRDFTGKPLRLNEANNSGQQSLTTFRKGLALRSRCLLEYRLPSDFNWLQATVGIDPATARQGHVVLRITGGLANGQRVELLEQIIAGSDPAVPIRVPLENLRTIRIEVDYGNNIDSGDNLHLGNVRITK